MASYCRALLIVVVLAAAAGCYPYQTKIHDVVDLRPTTAGRHAPVREVEIEQTRAWALGVFTYRHVDVGKQLQAQLDADPSMGLRNVTWESGTTTTDVYRWLGINGALIELAFLRQIIVFGYRAREVGGNIEASANPNEAPEGTPDDSTFRIAAGVIAGPANALIVSRTLRVTAEVVTIDERRRHREEDWDDDVAADGTD